MIQFVASQEDRSRQSIDDDNDDVNDDLDRGVSFFTSQATRDFQSFFLPVIPRSEGAQKVPVRLDSLPS